MSQVWFVIPSKRPPEEVEPVLKQWRERGYRIGLWRDPDDAEGFDECLIIRKYEGYAAAVNALAKAAIEAYPDTQWIVTGGDDVLPDPNHTAEEIAMQCEEVFGILAWNKDHEHTEDSAPPDVRSTFGVMQPTGDRWSDSKGPYIERVAGSPWMGREWCLRVNGGRGPLWPEYEHMFLDEELQDVATRLGVFWQRPDLTQLHQHWGRPRPGERMAPSSRMPEFLKRWNTPEHWKRSKNLYESRKASNFPGHEPI